MTMFLVFCFFGGGGGGTRQMFLYTVSSHFSFSSCATHYETFPLEEDTCPNAPVQIHESFRVVFYFKHLREGNVTTRCKSTVKLAAGEMQMAALTFADLCVGIGTV